MDDYEMIDEKQDVDVAIITPAESPVEAEVEAEPLATDRMESLNGTGCLIVANEKKTRPLRRDTCHQCQTWRFRRKVMTLGR